MTTEQRFDDRQELAAELARTIARDLRDAVAARGAASLVVSGGSTPRPLFERLRREPLPWSDVWITLADERWVPPHDDASNENLVRRHLLQDRAAAARWVSLKTDAPTPEAGRDACERRLRELPRPFDVVVLGMGADGHTASLFPGAPELEAALDRDAQDLCVAVRPADAPHPRMSLTLAALVSARRLYLHVTGAEKWDVYQRALEPGPEEEMPVRAVLRAAGEKLTVTWAA